MIGGPAGNLTAQDLSHELRVFTAGLPHERGPILAFAQRFAAEIPAGSRVLDVGAGDSPYRELFGHLQYESTDWEHSVHPGARRVDHVGPAHELPVPDAAYDAVLCTQVLEHVPNPAEVLAELHRVLRPGGRLYLTVPLTWELHELPFDFFRYTGPALARLTREAGFADPEVRPRNDCFETLAQLLANVEHSLGTYPDGRDGERAEAAQTLRRMAAEVERFAGLDARRRLTLGYSVVARRPEAGEDPAARRPGDRAAAGLADARRFATLCFAVDVLADPSVLRGYARRFSAADDATLVIYAPRVDEAAAGRALTEAVVAAGLDGDDAPDLLALPYPGPAPDEAALAAAVDAVLSLAPAWGPFAGVPHVHPGELDQLRALADARPAT